MATTRKDGTFTLWDPRYVGGTVQVAATLEGGDVTTLCPAPPNPKLACGTAYEADPQDWKSTALKFHKNIATVNLTFPPVEPQPPAPVIEIKVFRTKNGQRESLGWQVYNHDPVVWDNEGNKNMRWLSGDELGAPDAGSGGRGGSPSTRTIEAVTLLRSPMVTWLSR